LMKGLRAEHVTAIPDRPSLPPVARFEFFRTTGRQAGVWLVRQGRTQFALPFTTATKPVVADYLPAPHGLPGFAAPVEQLVPAIVPFLDLDDGRTIVAADGADVIAPAADGRSVRATWRRWAVIGGKSADFTDPGLQTDVEWKLDGETLLRTERLTATRPVVIRKWRAVVPTTCGRGATTFERGVRTATFDCSRDDIRRFIVTLPHADWPYTIGIRATGNGADGRGARGAIPLHLEVEARDLLVRPGTPQSWTVGVRIE
jgi:hypothetical protein